MKRLLALFGLALLLMMSRASAQGLDDQYVHIYTTIQDADSLNSIGQTRQALSKYLDAQSALQRFQKVNPAWNPTVINFRLNYLAGKITDLSAKVPAAAAPAPPAFPAPTGPTSTAPAAPPAPVPAANPPPARPPPAADAERQVNVLTEQVRQLQADKMVLEAKLKESLAAQPAPLDTRQLARAQDTIKSLQKDNDLLKVALEQAKSRTAPTLDAKAAEETKQALAEANRKLKEQSDQVNSLSLERTALQQKLRNLVAEAGKSTELENAREQLAQATRQLTEQKDLAAKLALERDSLQARLKTPDPAGDSAALRAENQLLKKQLADLAAAPPPAKGGEAARQLAQAQTQIAALQSDKGILRLEKMALENRMKALQANPAAPASPAAAPAAVVTSTVLPSTSKAGEAARIKQLEQERDDLQKKLGAANKELYGRGARTAVSRVQELENQVTVLRARLESFEARRVPYTAEELALFKQTELALAPNPRAGKKPIKELPPGSALLVAEADRFYAARQLDRAEENYLKVLKQDEKNVPALANLAAVQLGLKRPEDAEKNVRQALAIAPDDAYSLLVLGQIKFTQAKYDESIDTLSRAAKLEPQNAQIQNFLGMALTEKGLRGPAETALRRAIQIDPAYGAAHYSLAVVYATQQPPLVELARWHYQKALASGVPRSADLEKLFEARITVPNVQ